MAADYGFANVLGLGKNHWQHLAQPKIGGVITARVQKGLKGEEALTAPAAHGAGKDITMIVFSGDLDKAIAAFIIANGFASMGQRATLFFTFWGLNLLRKDNPPALKKTLVERMFGWMMRAARQGCAFPYAHDGHGHGHD